MIIMAKSNIEELTQSLISKTFINPSEEVVELVKNEIFKIYVKRHFLYRKLTKDTFYKYMCIEENVKKITETLIKDVYEDNSKNQIERKYSEEKFLQTKNKHNTYFEMKNALLEIFENNMY